MPVDNEVKVVRRRRVSAGSAPIQFSPLPFPNNGFGAIIGETEEDFYDRMFDLDPLQSIALLMEYEFIKMH